jgi:CBS-domain-containing membrane protein
VKTLLVSQMSAAAIGWVVFEALGPGYLPAGLALIVSINAMILLDVVHPPAVATAMSFALRAGDASNLALFGLAIAITAGLVFLQRSAVWMIRTSRRVRGRPPAAEGRRLSSSIRCDFPTPVGRLGCPDPRSRSPDWRVSHGAKAGVCDDLPLLRT